MKTKLDAKARERLVLNIILMPQLVFYIVPESTNAQTPDRRKLRMLKILGFRVPLLVTRSTSICIILKFSSFQ